MALYGPLMDQGWVCKWDFEKQRCSLVYSTDTIQVATEPNLHTNFTKPNLLGQISIFGTKPNLLNQIKHIKSAKLNLQNLIYLTIYPARLFQSNLQNSIHQTNSTKSNLDKLNLNQSKAQSQLELSLAQLSPSLFPNSVQAPAKLG